MSRIFFVLALLAVLALATNITLGLLGGNYNGASREQFGLRDQLRQLESGSTPDQDQIGELKAQLRRIDLQVEKLRRWHGLHMLCGIVAALITVLVNSVTITYFIGTSRWCKEVVETYGLESRLSARSNQLKRLSFPLALGAFFIVLLIVALGAAADPGGANFRGSASWVTPHYMTALIGTALIAWSLLAQVRNIAANYNVISEIVEHVQQIRRERGLDSELESGAGEGRGHIRSP